MPNHSPTFYAAYLLASSDMDQAAAAFLFQIKGQRNGPQKRGGHMAHGAPWRH
ncbi:hypothetical protein NtRootA4_09240 [Arthrobacter sp. NtRootA4]|nr:hypothetical protein NtRootA2_11460 [Arthrobacter sp. NtRootA2]BCW13945.1 hypothetical protein NtRootA4_09240 [Arthrobacter sp. NtRootA4]BCW22280.1 hypothetical protein NtRootC7_11470 [Arthrobacter sp. NtRootC7]BCW26549.1 hypothetical protein NtRootC45_11490 [Arthrobacter sp. NtRootC45]BCW30819.1 hypothetical protein NtRootD5_11500 [Arthrobacter sp. NtRootD5]